MDYTILDKLEKEISYFEYHNKNLTKEQDEKTQNIKELIKKTKDLNAYFIVCKYEIESAIDDIGNDELYGEYNDKLLKITDEDINRLAWKLDDMGIWDDIYTCARELIYDEIGAFEED